jgi:CheY-like chemotaxis protein
VARGLDIIERNARAQARLVDDMLDVSRVITGTLRLRTGVVDPATVITGAIDAVRLAAEAKGVRLEVVLDAAAGRVVGDAGRLQQVVWNLVANAIKFTPAGGGVAVRLGRAGGAVEISVRDSGEGIDPEFLPFLFDRFRQADSTISRRHGGLGLGLAIVRHLVELHGGEVRAESAGAGAGATFTVRLPVADPIPSPREGEAAAPGVALAGLDVLVVAGDPVSLDMLVVVLGGAGAVVRAATTAAEARDALRGRKPDALLCDLPPEAGHAVMDALRAFEADTGTWVPALALTGSAPAEDPSRARAAGFNLFVQKPMDPGELVLAIATLARPGDGAGEPSRGG